MAEKQQNSLIPLERIVSAIYLIRDQKVMLDYELAELYGVSTKRLNEQVTRNKDRFPEDFMFRLTKEETIEFNRSQFATSSQKHRDLRYPPRVFTQEGVAMLSSVLRSKQAIEVNITIIRTFVRLREMLATHKDIARKIDEHDKHIAALYDYVKQLLASPASKKNPIGYVWPEDDK